MRSVRFRHQWIRLTVAPLLAGITISWNLYAEYKMTDGQQRGLLGTQAKVVEYVINVSKVLLNGQGASAGVILASLCPEYFDTLPQPVLCAADMRTTPIHGGGKAIFEAPYRKGSADEESAPEPDPLFLRHLKNGQATSLSGAIIPFLDTDRLMVKPVHFSGFVDAVSQTGVFWALINQRLPYYGWEK